VRGIPSTPVQREEGALGQVEAVLVSEGGKVAVDVEAEEAGREALEQMRG
jgi:hypothetical protein